MPRSELEFRSLRVRAGEVFTPGAPINERELFAGRVEQLKTIVETINQPGYHALLYGERGVGKTSLANVLQSFLSERGSDYVLPKVNCDVSDSFSSLWKKVFKDLTFNIDRPGAGFRAEVISETRPILEKLPDTITPDDVRRVLSAFSQSCTLVVVIDEFDRASSEALTKLMADTIKLLSDFGIGATVLLVGVADSVDELIEGHESIERTLVQTPMPRMSDDEISEIVRTGVEKLGLEIEDTASNTIIRLSQGLPYVTHLLALHSTRAACDDKSDVISLNHVKRGIEKAISGWQQSIKSAYYEAVKSPQPGTIFREVLLACAIAEVDELGFFTAATVRAPLSAITGKSYEIPSFSHHLKKFSTSSKGQAPVLDRSGTSRRFRYRFNNPLMRPYIVMRGVAEGLISDDQLAKLDRFNAPDQ